MKYKELISVFYFLQDEKGKNIPFLAKIKFKLPFNDEDLIYNGNINIMNRPIEYLPDNLIINGDLEFYNVTINKFGDNMKINGSLRIVNSKKIEYLPNNLYVKGILNLNNTNISYLPDDLYVGGNFYCRNTPLAFTIKNDPTYLDELKKVIKGLIIYKDYEQPIPIPI